MEFLFLPQSLRNYPGRGIACIACVLWSLRRGTHTQYSPNTHLILTQYTPKLYVLQHITQLFFGFINDYSKLFSTFAIEFPI